MRVCSDAYVAGSRWDQGWVQECRLMLMLARVLAAWREQRAHKTGAILFCLRVPGEGWGPEAFAEACTDEPRMYHNMVA